MAQQQLRLNRSMPFATMTQAWRGAMYKQPPTPNGHYFDGDGTLIIIPGISPVSGNGSSGNGTARQPAADRQPTGFTDPGNPDSPYRVVFSHGGLKATINGVPYLRAADVLTDEALTDDAVEDIEDPEADMIEAAPEDAPPPKLPTTDADPAALSDLTQIEGIGPDIAQDLRSIGITNIQALAALSKDEIADLGGLMFADDPSRPAREKWTDQAIKLLAKLVPGSVNVVEPERVKADMTKEELVAWAKREGPPRHWQTVRKAIEALLFVKVSDEVGAIDALIREKLITADEARRPG